MFEEGRPYTDADLYRVWTKEGWDPTEAAEWIAAEWHATIIFPNSLEEDEPNWARTAAKWRDQGWRPADARAWLPVALNPTTANRWAAAGYVPSDAGTVADALSLERRSDEEGPSWLNTGLPIESIASFIAAGLSPAEAVAWPGAADDPALRTLTVLRRGV
jgi:hypothetical protein